jgi:Arc/MetJ-type ribon-helix-helix transcriptional regulator
MFHQTLWEADGDITNLEIQAAQGQRFREAQVELLRRCTGQSKDKIRKDIERDYYMSADEALRYGIIDKVIYHTSAARRDTTRGGIGAAAAGKPAAKAAGADKPVKSSGSPGRRTASRAQATKSGRTRNGR